MSVKRVKKPATKGKSASSAAKVTAVGTSPATAKAKPKSKTKSAAKAKRAAKAKSAAAKAETPAPTAAKKPTSAEASASTTKRKPTKANADEPRAIAAPARPKDDGEHGRQLLRELTALVGGANDRVVEQILGDGGLEGFLAAVVPQKRRPTHTVHQHLTAHKRRASLMAQVRHAINESCSFEDGGGYVSPTRVQWFYDGLTFLVGAEPFGGVVGFYRDGELRYGLGLSDLARGRSLGPRESDFVSIDQAKKSLRAGLGDARVGLSDLMTALVENADATGSFVDILERQPWMLGAQHVSVTRAKDLDEDLPQIFAKRSADGFHDIIVLAPATTGTVGKNGKVLQSLHDLWHRAERYLSFVERQSDYLTRELQLKVREPRCWLIAGAGLTPEEREVIRDEKEAHTMALRFLTYDDLRALAARTLDFFEPRL